MCFSTDGVFSPMGDKTIDSKTSMSPLIRPEFLSTASSLHSTSRSVMSQAVSQSTESSFVSQVWYLVAF